MCPFAWPKRNTTELCNKADGSESDLYISPNGSSETLGPAAQEGPLWCGQGPPEWSPWGGGGAGGPQLIFSPLREIRVAKEATDKAFGKIPDRALQRCLRLGHVLRLSSPNGRIEGGLELNRQSLPGAPQLLEGGGWQSPKATKPIAGSHSGEWAWPLQT